MFKDRTSKHGFTLIELLIVIAIIAILALIAIPNFLEAQTRSKISRVKADMRTVGIGMESYFVDCQDYPPNYGSSDEINSYKHLTTPIAYLTSIGIDVFNFANKDPNRRQFVYGRHSNPYITVGTGVPVYNTTYQTYQDLQNKTGVLWTIASYGPDLDDDALWFITNIVDPVLFANKCYDPTNGTISNGDLARCAKGALPTN